MIRRLLTPDVSQRATITDVCKDSWVNQGCNTSLLEMAENMALAAGLPRTQMNVTKLCLETNAKNEQEKVIFKKAVAQLEENAGKFTSIFSKNFENIAKTNDINSQPRKSLHEQITNYDVRFVLNKLITAVESSLNADKNTRHLTTAKGSTILVQRKEETVAEKVDSAYVIPIFEVTSTIPNERDENLALFKDKAKRMERRHTVPNTVPTKTIISKSEKEHYIQERTHTQNSENKQNKNILSEDGNTHNRILTDSQKQYYSLDVSGHAYTHNTDLNNRKLKEQDIPLSRCPSPKMKRMNDGLPLSQKPSGPFLKTKHHVLSLARLLSMNYERLMRSSFRLPQCKKKLPGKITIPPTFDPNNLPATMKKQQEEKKELLIFPTVSVSENKEKIEKKIEKIKKAALNKNLIIRSDSKTRLRIEKYIRSQVKRIQDLVCEEQRSLQASLEHLDEQSLRDMSEMYYRAFGSENTDSGIANTEDDEYFCFLCSKPNREKGISSLVDSLVLDSIKKGCLYTSNHLHIPRGKEHNKWNYASNGSGLEFGTLSKCKSEIHFPIEYLNYISPYNKTSDLSKRAQQKQHIQKNNIGNTKCFFTIPSSMKSDNSNLRLLRSASDSVGLNLSNNTFDVVKLNTDNHDDVLQNYNLIPHFLEHASTSSRCDYSQMTDHFDTQSFATDADNTFTSTSHILEKDDGIGDSRDSFQSYIEALECNIENNSEISRSKSSHSYMNFSKEDSGNNQGSFPKKLPSEPYLKQKYASANDFEKHFAEADRAIMDILDSDACSSTLANEDEFDYQKAKNRGLRRRNTMTCVRDKSIIDENLRIDETSTEFENYLWNAYKEHVLENTESDTEYSNSSNLKYYSLDRNGKFKHRNCKSMDYVNGERVSDLYSANSPNLLSLYEQDTNELNTGKLGNILKHSSITNNHSHRSARSASRTKSTGSDYLSDSDRDDIVRKLRSERKLSHESRFLDSNKDMQSPFLSSILNDLEKKEQSRRRENESNRRHYSKNTLPLSKKTKSEYKKSFLQLLALKRIQEAEKELDKPPRSELPDVEEENSGSLLEALKTHGYKTVISQRFQSTDADSQDPFHMRYAKSPNDIRAELARLDYMYYESLPRYTLDPYEETGYLYDDLDYTTGFLNGLPTPSFYDIPNDFRQKTPKQSIYDWLNTTQTDDYLNNLRSDALYIPEETTPTSDTRKCCTKWGKENSRSFDDESTTESQDTTEEHISNNAFNSNLKTKESIDSNKFTNYSCTENSHVYSNNTDDERQESVHDRIWRKSFYSRFNNRALSRKERSSFIEPEMLSESRLGLLNNLYNPSRAGSEMPPWEGSSKSFTMKKSRKHSGSVDKYEPNSSIRKKYSKRSKEREILLNKGASNSNRDACNTAIENEVREPEH